MFLKSCIQFINENIIGNFIDFAILINLQMARMVIVIVIINK